MNLRSFDVYLTAEFCLSCAYFNQIKGHFGYCVEKKDHKLYDGARRGNACVLWRIKTSLSAYEGLTPNTEPSVRIAWLQRKQSLGSFTPSLDTIRATAHHCRAKPYRRVNDYSYPPCGDCGGRTVRVGHGHLGGQRYKCVDCGKKLVINEVRAANPPLKASSPLKFNHKEFMRSLKPLALVRFFFRNVEKLPKQQYQKVIIEPLSYFFSWVNTLNLPDVPNLKTDSCLSCPICPICHSKDYVKIGVRINKKTRVQRYQCKGCKHKFTGVEDGKRKITKESISNSLILLSQGYSYRAMQKTLKSAGLNVSYQAIMKYVKKYFIWRAEH